MTTITRTFPNSGNYTISETKYNQICEMSDYEQDAVDSALFYNWDDNGEHQEWLNDAPLAEIANWVDTLCGNWGLERKN
jgi:hypothetical protein